MQETTRSYFWPGLLILVLGLGGLWLAASKPHAPATQALSSWKIISHFNLPRRALAAVATETHLYVLGGVDEDGHYVQAVEYAPIRPDGSVGPWTVTSSLQVGRFYLAAAAYQGYLYAIGGGGGDLGDDNVPLASVERARINPDGSLGPWQIDSYMSTPRRGLKTVLYQGRLYAIGGYNGTFLKSTEHLDLNRPPEQRAWQLDPELSRVDRYIHSSTLLNGRIYLLGGHVEKAGPMSYGDVEYAQIKPDGFLEPWQIASTRLRMPRFIASAFAYGDQIYLLGGHNGRSRLASVETAIIARNGEVGPWSDAPSLSQERSTTAVARHGKRIYVLGGISNRNVLNSVEMATVTSGP